MTDIGIKELAKFAGVSTASASRALSNPGRVSNSMREKVQAAAKEIGYRPNKLGASLRTSKTRNIIAIIPDISDTFNSGVIQSLERTATERDYSVLFGDTQGLRERELAYGDMVRSKQADGIILFSHRLPFDERDLKSDNFTMPPLVNSCEQSNANKTQGLPWVSIDNIAAAKDATNHLLSTGHTEIAVITGCIDSPSTTQRLQGYREALADAGLPYRDELVHFGDYTLESGHRCTKDLLATKLIPTAIFCMCDETALGCLSTLKEQGYSLPEDMSVVGFDDIRFAKYFTPSLTTIAQPVEDIGRRCVEVLLDIIDGNPLDKTDIILPHKLVVRDSTQRLQKK
ncbi:MAG: LacI family transcriptional regulator [Acidiferrobacterales bacterium]|nr:LacI family transcriptional regulator [Acidiferrobacterales bacterium]